MLLARVVEYTDIFPEDEGNLPDVKTLISGINRRHLVTLTSNMMSRLIERPFFDADLEPTTEVTDFVRFFLSGVNSDFLRDVVHRFRLFDAKSKAEGYDGQFFATRPVAIIRFQRYFFSLPPCEDEFSPEMEINFFKAMLLMNQEVNYTSNYQVDNDAPLDLQIADLYLAYNYGNEGIEPKNINDTFRRQLVRFSELICFLERQKCLKPMRELFRQHYHLDKLVHYLAPHVITSFCAGNKSVVYDMSHCNKSGRKIRYIMKKSSIPYDAVLEFNDNMDYSYFRANPYIELKKHCYVSISIQFVLEHIYESMYFQLKPYSVLSGFKSSADFRRYITTEFTQNWMLNRFMVRCLRGRENVALSGTHCEKLVIGQNIKGIEPPDYYIREGNNVVLFELKDTLGSAKNKELRDVNEFFIDLRKRFYENGEGSPKAIKQLMNNAAAIQNGIFKFDKEAPTTSIIYPVLIVDSMYFTMRGIRTKLESWMRDYCKIKKIDGAHVRPLVLMDVSTLRLYSESFNKYGFAKLFDDYFKSIEWSNNPNPESLWNSIKSFSEYMAETPMCNTHDVCRSVMTNIMRGYKRH